MGPPYLKLPEIDFTLKTRISGLKTRDSELQALMGLHLSLVLKP